MESKRPRVLIVGPRGLFGCEGGIEKFTDAFIPRTLPYADITVLTIIETNAPLPKGLNVIKVPRSKRFKTDKAMYLLYAVVLHLKQKYDHIFIFGTNFAILIPLLRAVFWKKPKIHLRSGSIDHHLPKWGPMVKKLLEVTERFAKYADTVIAVAPSIQKHLASLGISSFLVRNGIDRCLNHKSLENRNLRSVVAIGRITVQKNYKVLIRAIQSLGSEAPTLTIIGGADLSDEAQKLKKLLKPDDNIHFVGALPRESVFENLLLHSLFVNCSIHEGMSNAVLEAVQHGIPILVSDIDANRDLILPEHHYFKPDDIRSCAKKILDALNNPEFYVVDPLIFDDWDISIQNTLVLTGVVKSNMSETTH